MFDALMGFWLSCVRLLANKQLNVMGGSMRVVVIGGTGFIGRQVVRQLLSRGYDVRVPTRQAWAQAGVTLVQADVHTDAALDEVVAGCDIVINLVGILHSRTGQPYGVDFDKAHVQLPRRIAQACYKQGVEQLIHVSALGADAAGPSGYLRSKAAGEAAIARVYANADTATLHTGTYTIFQPSVVFGPDDQFMNMFAQLARFLPVLPIAGAQAQLQPVFVGDVATAIVNVIAMPQAHGTTYELAGPRIYTLGQLVQLAAQWSGRKRWVLPLPLWLGQLQALLFECLPGKPLMSRDNLASLSVNNVSTGPIDPNLGVVLTAMEDVVPGYLGHKANSRP